MGSKGSFENFLNFFHNFKQYKKGRVYKNVKFNMKASAFTPAVATHHLHAKLYLQIITTLYRLKVRKSIEQAISKL